MSSLALLPLLFLVITGLLTVKLHCLARFVNHSGDCISSWCGNWWVISLTAYQFFRSSDCLTPFAEMLPFAATVSPHVLLPYLAASLLSLTLRATVPGRCALALDGS